MHDLCRAHLFWVNILNYISPKILHQVFPSVSCVA